VKATVVLFGGTGYVGGYLVAELERRGHEVVMVTREGAAAQGPSATVRRMTDAELSQLRGRRVVVVNLAYPRSVGGVEIRRSNERLIARVTGAVEATAASRLVHTSTQAVFGYEWRRAPRAKAAPLVLGDTYIESKRHAEDALRRHWRRRGRHDFVIVRLGNVLGAGAMPWVTATAQRILEGRPAAARGGQGRLNGTHVRNIAHYLATLVEHEARVADGERGVYHHLAEFADRSWSDLIEPMARAIGVRPVYRADVPVLGRPGAFTLVRSGARRFAGALARRPALLTLAQRIQPPPRLSANAPTVEDPGWHAITGGDIALPAALLPDWTPPHGWAELVAEVQEWLPRHGYALRTEKA
jgi:nucleoside-diphosphate-sugar epimerase